MDDWWNSTEIKKLMNYYKKNLINLHENKIKSWTRYLNNQ